MKLSIPLWDKKIRNNNIRGELVDNKYYLALGDFRTCIVGEAHSKLASPRLDQVGTDFYHGCEECFKFSNTFLYSLSPKDAEPKITTRFRDMLRLFRKHWKDAHNKAKQW